MIGFGPPDSQKVFSTFGRLANKKAVNEAIYTKINRGHEKMYKVKVYVTLKKSVIDPHGSAVEKKLRELDYNEVSNIRVGKYIEFFVKKSDRDVEEVVKEVCEKMLVNPVIEDFRYEIEESVNQ